jgi:hypothetical protein
MREADGVFSAWIPSDPSFHTEFAPIFLTPPALPGCLELDLSPSVLMDTWE